MITKVVINLNDFSAISNCKYRGRNSHDILDFENGIAFDDDKKKEYNFSSLENRECNGNLYFSNIIFLEIRERKHDCNSHRDANPPRLNFNKQYPTMNACSVDNSVNGVRNVE